MKNSNHSPGVRTRRALPVSITQVQASRLFHVAAPRRVLERLVRHPDHLVLSPDVLAQVDVVDWIVRFRERPGATWAVNPGLLQRGNELVLLTGIAAHGVQTGGQQQTGVIALYGIDVGVALVCLRVGFAKG